MEPNRFANSTADIAASAVIVAVGVLLYLMVKRALRLLERDGHVEKGMSQRLMRVIKWFVVGAVLLIVVQQAGVFRNAWALLSAIIATIAVGFVALWSVLSNVVCAVLILTFRPFRQGDTIELLEPSGPSIKDGTRFRGLIGIVDEVNLMFTSLHEANDEGERTGYELRVPNNTFFQKTIRVRARTNEPSPSFYDRRSAR